MAFFLACFNSLIHSKARLSYALSATNKDVEFFAQLVVRAINQIGKRKAGDDYSILVESFNHAMATKNSEWASKVQIRIIQLNHGKFIYEDFLLLLKVAKNKSNFFWAYYKAVFYRIPEFCDAFFNVAVTEYLECVKKSEHYYECAKLLDHSDEISEDTVLTEIIKGVENNLSLKSPSENMYENMEFLYEIKIHRRIKTQPDIIGLIMTGLTLEESILIGRRLGDNWCNDMPSLKGIDRKRYNEYLKWVLPSLVELKSSPKDYGQILKFLISPRFESDLMNVYIGQMDKISNTKKDLECFSQFLVYFLSIMPAEKNKSILLLSSSMRDGIVGILANQSESRKKKLSTMLQRDKHCSNWSVERFYAMSQVKVRV